MQETLITKETAVLGETIGYPFHTYPNVPTQSLLQKWLRDVHNIEIAVQWFDNCYIKAVAKKPFKANTYRVEGIDTYEEALELGLQEALTLIK